MTTEKHIAALLYRYQCVTVPGFGAFLTEMRSAQLNTETGAFYPPSKRISFNANLKNNDGLLANHIALQEKISYEQALLNIEEHVNRWLTLLLANETLSLKNIGDIARNAEGSLVFTPDTPVNYLTNAFGLGSFISPAIKRETYKEQAEAMEEKAPVVLTPERRKRYTGLKYAATVALLLGVGATGFKLYHDRQVQQQTLAVEQAVQERLDNKIQEASFFIGNPLPAVQLTVKEAHNNYAYHVVAGAFRSEDNAEKALQQLLKDGYKASRLEKNKYGLYPVLYGSYATYEEAQQNIRQLHRAGNDEAWLLIQQ